MHIHTLFKYWTYRFFAPGVVLRETYEAFRLLLSQDSRSHELMADLEALYYQGKKEDFCRIVKRYQDLSTSVGGMVESLERMAPGSFVTLREYFRKFDFYNKLLLAPPTLRFGPPFALPLDGTTALHLDLVGAKSTHLAELANALHLPVPCGFVITVNSLNYLLEYNDLRSRINELLAQIDLAEPDGLKSISGSLMDLIKKADVPPDINDSIFEVFNRIFVSRSDDLRLAVRSSAVHEDSECSFAGQYTTVLNVQKTDLLQSYLNVLASKYTEQALSYRINAGLSDEETAMAVLVVEMVDSLASGVVYTVSPAFDDTCHLFIHAVHGQGDDLVSGRTIPEVLAIDKKNPSLCESDPHGIALDLKTTLLTSSQAKDLACNALRIETHFGEACDIEWALTGSGELMFLQSRPLHTQQALFDSADQPEVEDTLIQPLLKGGITAALGQAVGPAYCLDSAHPLEQVPEGSILVARETLPSYVSILGRVSGVLAEFGSVASHFATVCREYGIPLLCSLGDLIDVVSHGQVVTMQAAEKVVYLGDFLPRLKAAPPLYETQRHLPFFMKMRKLLDGITPLHMIDVQSRDFAPESCRSLHDIIRFAHEKAVSIMFSLGDRLGSPSRNRKKLLSELPFDIFVVDVGGGLDAEVLRQDTFRVEQVRSEPFLALWAGLCHPSVQWPDHAHFDWKHFGEMIMADGIASTNAPELASYAVLGGDYTHLIMRFGYHFTLVDVLCCEDSACNYCQFRFAGGGAGFPGRMLRLDFISTVLKQEGFQIDSRGDLLDARLAGLPVAEMKAHLLSLGRLLGVTRLMDMVLHDQEEVEQYVQKFLAES
ncbi:MAG: hypothetical protein EHM86_01580 [Desulfobulbaceae bacterium]|nr:MAG: hypothetical protein EHM86_01580 [Desulfobulbaceae bacterium]